MWSTGKMGKELTVENPSKQYQEMFLHTYLFHRNLTTPMQNI